MAERLRRLATDTFGIKIGKCIHNKKMPYLELLREFAPKLPVRIPACVCDVQALQIDL